MMRNTRAPSVLKAQGGEPDESETVTVASERERERRNAPCLGGRYRGAGSRDTEGVPLAQGTLKVSLLAQRTRK